MRRESYLPDIVAFVSGKKKEQFVLLIGLERSFGL